jgi:peptide deformylase
MHILLHPHDALRKIAEPVPELNESLKTLVREMFDLMYKSKGVGLAAPQVGESIQLFVANTTGDFSQKDKEWVFINPKIVKHSKRKVVFNEGCLSFPGLYLDIERPKTIVIEFTNLNGELQKLGLDGIPSRVCQHEYDHLIGKLIIDHQPQENK